MNTLTIVALVHTTPTVVYRMLSVCRRYRAQVESVTIARTEQQNVSRMTLVLTGVPATPLLAQLRKLIDVLEIHMDEEPGVSSLPSVSHQGSLSTALSSHSAQADGAF